MQTHDSAARVTHGNHTERRRHEPTRLRLIDGDGADVSARRPVPPTFTRALRIVVIAVTLLISLGFVSVTLTVQTVPMLQRNELLRTKVKSAREENEKLSITRSILSSTERIKRIATQNLGMAYATDVEVLELKQKPVETPATRQDGL